MKIQIISSCVRENRKSTAEWTDQRQKQHCAQDTVRRQTKNNKTQHKRLNKHGTHTAGVNLGAGEA